MGRRAVGIALVAAAVVVVATGAVAVWHRGEYHEWPLVSSPNRLEYCDREYGGPAAEIRPPPSTLYHAFTFSPPLAPHHEVFSATPVRHVDGQVCSMSLWMRLGDHEYRVYSLEGGP